MSYLFLGYLFFSKELWAGIKVATCNTSHIAVLATSRNTTNQKLRRGQG